MNTYERLQNLRDQVQQMKADPASKDLLHKPREQAPEGCHCEPGKCSAPVIMGKQMPCRDQQKAADIMKDKRNRVTEKWLDSTPSIFINCRRLLPFYS